MEPQIFEVICQTRVEATDPVEAARIAFNWLRYQQSRPTRFMVGRWRTMGPYREGYSLPIELGSENPYGRPKAYVEDGAVLCGHCDSDNTRYIEDVSRYAPFTVRDGVPTSCATDFEADEDGGDPRVWCFGCGQESMLPDGFALEPVCPDDVLPGSTEGNDSVPASESPPTTKYHVTWAIDLEADSPQGAAIQALGIQRTPGSSATVFSIAHDAGGEFVTEEIDLGEENPFHWPQARIENESVICGHCGSGETFYVEDVGQYARLWAEDGVAFCSGGDLQPDEDGDDPRVWCITCNKVSVLPKPLQWV
jgi:uncharacterized CHY-type Zn-finger protein